MTLPRICIFIPSYGDGGVERMVVNIARGLARQGLPVDFATTGTQAPFLSLLKPDVRLIDLGAAKDYMDSFSAYLQREHPDIVLTAKEQAHAEALAVRRSLNADFKLIVCPATTVSKRLERRGFLKRRRVFRAMRAVYPQADRVVANSRGVAQDTARITRIDQATVEIIHNPVVTPELRPLAAEPAQHPWLINRAGPVVLGAGGLRHQKDFSTLIRATAAARVQRPDLRLIILGQGRMHAALVRLAGKLGIADAVDFPGFIENPYPYMVQADLFVLSSAWEGSPNVLSEALALGTPVVSTDCESGPREILQNGRYGRLVPVGAVREMAAAMVETLRDPLPAETLREAVAEYTMEETARRYKAVILELMER